MSIIKVKNPPVKVANKRDVYATVCYYFPQYTLKDAQNLSARDVQLLIKTAQKMEAMRMYNLTQVVAAPHSNKQKGVKKLLDHFKKVIGE